MLLQKPALVTSLLFVLLVFLSAQALATPVRIQAENSGRWDLKTKIFYVEGDVRVGFDDVEIQGDYLQWDVSTQELYMQGNVVLFQEENEFHGEALTYNVETAKGKFTQVRTELIAEGAQGPIFVFSERLGIDEHLYTVTQATVTTCDINQPHYHIAAREILVYPGERMVIHSVTYYEGRIPIFYWPYLSIPLDDDRGLNFFALPRIGYASEQGYYIKNSYNYYFNRTAFGSIYYDFYSLLGFGYGVRHNYVLPSLGEGNLYGYTIPSTERQRVQWQHRYMTDRINFNTDNAYEQEFVSGMVDEKISTKTSLIVREDSFTFQGRANYADQTRDQPGEEWLLDGNWQQSITDNLRLTAKSSITHRDYGIRRRMVNHLVETSYRISNHTISIALQQQYNPDVMEEDLHLNWSSVNRVPELRWQWRNPNLANWSIPGTLQLGLGRYQEFPSDTLDHRMLMKLDLNNRSWRPTNTTTLTYNGSFTGHLYGQGSAQQIVQTRINYNQRIATPLSFRANYSRRDVWGETPFSFDRQREQNLLTTQLSYNRAPISASLRSGFDYLTELYQNVTGQIRVRQGDWNANVSANYNLNTQTPGNMVGIVSYQPNAATTMKLGTRYKLADKQWDRIDGQLSFDLTDTWAISYNAIYLPQTQRWRQGQVTLTLDLHCRELSIRYDQVRQEVFFQYTLNAFPSLPLRFSSTEGVSLFDLDDIQDILGVEDEMR